MLRVGGSGGRHWVSIPSLLFSVIHLHLDFILSFGVVLAAAVLSCLGISHKCCAELQNIQNSASPTFGMI